MIALGADCTEGILILLLNDTSLNELTHHIFSVLAPLSLLLHRLYLQLQHLEPCGLDALLVLPLQLSLFCFLDLAFGPPLLIFDLEHLAADALGPIKFERAISYFWQMVLTN